MMTPEEEQVEATLRELIRTSVEVAFAAFRVIGVRGIVVRGNLVTYEPDERR